MQILPSAEQLRAKAQVGAEDYDFYRCHKCNRLITRIEEIRAFTSGTDNYGHICPCGSEKYLPTNLKWYEWLIPRVLQFAYFRIRGIA